MEANTFSLYGRLLPAPTTKRSYRVGWSLKQTADTTVLAYGVGKNVVIRDLKDESKTIIYTRDITDTVTAVKWNHNGAYLGFGTANGDVFVISWSQAENGYVVKIKKDNLLAGGTVNDLAWIEENTSSRVVAVGSGNTRVKGFDIGTGVPVAGDLVGHQGPVLSVDAKTTRPFKMVLAGEDQEIQCYKGPPFQLLTSLHNASAGYINRIRYTPWDNFAHFITVSADKSIKLYSTETNELVFEKQGAHDKSIMDFAFRGENEIVTSSNDSTCKVFKVNMETKTFDEVFVYNLASADDQVKQQHLKQLLGVLVIQD